MLKTLLEKKATLELGYLIGKSFSLLTRLIKKMKWLQILEKVNFMFDFRKWGSNVALSKIVTAR